MSVHGLMSLNRMARLKTNTESLATYFLRARARGEGMSAHERGEHREQGEKERDEQQNALSKRREPRSESKRL